jgi:hypothetical protein
MLPTLTTVDPPFIASHRDGSCLAHNMRKEGNGG